MRKSPDNLTPEIRGHSGRGVLGPEASVDVSTLLNPVKHYRRLKAMGRSLQELLGLVEK